MPVKYERQTLKQGVVNSLVTGPTYSLDEIPDRMIVSGSTTKESMDWLSDLNIPFVVYDSQNIERDINKIKSWRHLEPNRGNEVHAYLRFIIDHYDRLPEAVVFIHGHSTSWHSANIPDMLQHLRWPFLTQDNEDLQTSTTSQGQMYQSFDFQYFQSIGLGHQDIERPYLCRFWDQAGLATEIGQCPPFLKTECCAQFVVHRSRILLRSRAFYKGLLHWILNQTEFSNHFAGMLVEWSWGVIMGQPFDIQWQKDPCVSLLYC
eukprot:GILJ01018269.1.p1 GENE.GILJ01018269.1~~GILJ01018269.1.p1  ORF type:complete len:298 (-),score=31.60 GILJ01018269.1:8-793(-)